MLTVDDRKWIAKMLWMSVVVVVAMMGLSFRASKGHDDGSLEDKFADLKLAFIKDAEGMA